MIGDPYPGPSPFQLHFTSPVLTSYAVSAPSMCPPTWKMTSPRSMSGEKACEVYIGTTPVPGFCQSCLPVAASHAVTVPTMPMEYSLPLDKIGVDLGPGPWRAAALCIVKLAG